MSRIRVLWIVVAVAVVGLAGLAAWRFHRSEPCCTDAHQTAPSFGGDFHLIDQAGQPVDQSLLEHKWTAVFFGYTYCPDVCPTTLQTLGSASQQLGARARDFQVVFVTVDPQRDTPAVLKAYLSSAAFPHGTIGLTGTSDQIAAIAKAYGVYYQKQGEGAAYAVDHSSAIYLMNPQGQFDSVIAYGLTPEETRDQILKAMRRGGSA